MCDFKEGGWLHTYPHKEHLEDRHQGNHNHLTTLVKIQGGFMQESPFLGRCFSEANGDNHRKPQLDTLHSSSCTCGSGSTTQERGGD